VQPPEIPEQAAAPQKPNCFASDSRIACSQQFRNPSYPSVTHDESRKPEGGSDVERQALPLGLGYQGS
jgi:hypothetical protein